LSEEQGNENEEMVGGSCARNRKKWMHKGKGEEKKPHGKPRRRWEN